MLPLLAVIGQHVLNNAVGTESQVIANESQESIADKNRIWQSFENEKQRDWEEKQWLYEQQYNSPSAQMQRYKEAGLNPFLSDTSKVGAGETTAPSAPPLSSAPGIPHIQPYNFGNIPNMITDFLRYDLERQKVNSEVANQQSDTFDKYVQMAMRLREDGQVEMSNKVLDFGLSQIGNVSHDVSLVRDRMDAAIGLQKAQRDMQILENNLVQKYGASKAEKQLQIMQASFDKAYSEIDLNDAVRSLRIAEERLANVKSEHEKSEIRVNIARIKDLLSSAWNNFQQGCRAQSESMTIDDMRSYVTQSAIYKSLEDQLNFNRSQIEFEGDKGYFSWLLSDKGKAARRANKVLQNDPLSQYGKNLTVPISNILPSILFGVK